MVQRVQGGHNLRQTIPPDDKESSDADPSVTLSARLAAIAEAAQGKILLTITECGALVGVGERAAHEVIAGSTFR